MTTIDFALPNPRQSPVDELRRLLGEHDGPVDLCVAYVRKSGFELIQDLVRSRLKHPRSRFVASVDYPTDLDLIAALHSELGSSIRLHLGHASPMEIGLSGSRFRPKMHSKIFVSHGDDHFSAWVGSHNLTAYALAGTNIEAGTCVRGLRTDDYFGRLSLFLEATFAEAEEYDPDRRDFYNFLQRGGSPDPPGVNVVEQRCLVIQTVCPPGLELADGAHVIVRVPDDSYFRTMSQSVPVRFVLYQDADSLETQAGPSQVRFHGVAASVLSYGASGSLGLAAEFAGTVFEVSPDSSGVPALHTATSGRPSIAQGEAAVLFQVTECDEPREVYFDLAAGRRTFGSVKISDGEPDRSFEIDERFRDVFRGLPGPGSRLHSLHHGKATRSFVTRSFDEFSPLVASGQPLGGADDGGITLIPRHSRATARGDRRWERFIYFADREISI